jgi:DNA-binding response OmpR family regulator
MNVLVVDDDKPLLKSIGMILEVNGHEATCVDHTDDALSMVADNQYDFVLVDYRMKETTGADFLKEAKLPPSTKTLLITGHVDRDIINTMFDLGVSGYIIKPFSEGELLQHLDFHSK